VYASGPKAPARTEGIYFSRSDDDGATFFPESMVVSAPGAMSPAFPQIAVDSNRNVTFHLFFGHSADRGTTFPTIRPLPTMSPSVLCIPLIPSGTAPPYDTGHDDLRNGADGS